MKGTKYIAEDVGCFTSVGERSVLDRSVSESERGRIRSENVGLSSENIGENPMPRKPKVSSGRFVHRG